jgi:ABC-2 type transport system permease protein
VTPERRPDWLPVARWELWRIVRRADFILSVLFTPVLAIGMSVGMKALARDETHHVAVARVDSTGALTARGEAALAPLAGYRWLDPGAAGGDTVALAAAVRAKTFDAALVIPSELGTSDRAADMVTRHEPPSWTRAVTRHVAEVRLAERAAACGLSPEQVASLDEPVAWRTHVATGQRSADRKANLVVTFSILILMVSVLMTSISYLMVGIGGEKSARVTEVVVSAIPAQAWMDGKILAFTGVGLIVGVVWAGSLLLVAGPLSFAIPGTVHAGTLAITLLYAFLGLMLYNAFIAALIASAQNLQSASRWQSSFIMLPFIPVAFFGALLDSPDATWLVVVSQIPFFSPVMMPTRMVLGAARPWEVALGLAVLAASFWLMRLAAGRVFRLGMLMYGKDMTLPQLLRWARVK